MLSLGDKYLDYTVSAFIGRGGMGTVLLLKKEDGAKAALKILHPHLMDDDELVRRFYLEAEVAQRIDCGRICKVFDVREVSLGEKKSHGILMEFVEGESLADMMENGEAFGEEWALHVADGVLEALEAIHKAGLLHRDIKPENIHITPDDTIKLLDLGLAKVLESSIKLSKTGYFVGTYQYASPEQLTGDDLNFSCDIYSLGIVLYELTTGARPHKSEDIRELIYEKVNQPVREPSRLNPTLSPFFDMLLADILEIKPDHRIQTASRMREIINLREKSDWYRARVSMSVSLDNISTTTSLRRMIRVPRRTALYGRKKELEDLRTWVREALGLRKFDSEAPRLGNGLTVFIGGEAGIGKTRLIEEVVTELEAGDEPFVVLLGRSLQEKKHVPYAPLIEMVRDFFLLDDNPEVDLVKLFSEYLPNLRPLIPPFLELVTHKRFLDDSDIRGVLNESNLLHLFRTLFNTIAGEIPLILFFDDLQWADVNTISVLSYLTSDIGSSPLMIIGSYREEELEDDSGTSHPLVEVLVRYSGKPEVRRISLVRLDKQAVKDIVGECFPAASFVEDLAERVYEKSDGNPFFAIEILNLLFDEGKVGFVNGRWEMKGESSAIEIPSSLRDIVAFRLDRLSEGERDILEGASIIGYRFTSELLSRLVEIKRLKLLRSLQKLEKNRRLIVCHEAGYRFDHHVVYETVYSGIIPELRIEYHKLAADILTVDGDIYPTIYNLVYHLGRAGEDGRLLGYLPIACARARSEYSNRLALEHAEWGWDAYQRMGQPEEFRSVVADLMGQRSEVAGILGERETEHESAQRMLDLAIQLEDLSLASMANRLLGEYARNISEWDLALEKFNLSLESCQETRGPERAAILRQTASVLYFRGDAEKAIVFYRQALDALKRNLPDSELVKTHNNLGISLKKTGRLDEAVQEFETANEIARDIGDLHAETFPLGSLALIHYDAGRWEKAHELFVTLLNILEQTGDLTSRARTLLNIGNIFYQVGIYDQAREYFNESLRARQQMGHRLGETIVLHHLAHIDCEKGEFSDAVDKLTEALSICQEIGHNLREASTLGVLARVNNLAGRNKVALECVQQALVLGEEGGFQDRLIEAKMEGFFARFIRDENKKEIADEVKTLVDEAVMKKLISLGPKALIRVSQLQYQCGLEEEMLRSIEAARTIVINHLEQLEDPEWRASFKLLYQGIL